MSTPLEYPATPLASVSEVMVTGFLEGFLEGVVLDYEECEVRNLTLAGPDAPAGAMDNTVVGCGLFRSLIILLLIYHNLYGHSIP